MNKYFCASKGRIEDQHTIGHTTTKTTRATMAYDSNLDASDNSMDNNIKDADWAISNAIALYMTVTPPFP